MKLIRFLSLLLLLLVIALALALFVKGLPELPRVGLETGARGPATQAPNATATSAASPTPTLTAAQHESAAAALLTKGKAQRADGDYEEAIASLAEVVSKHPTAASTVEARLRLGELYRLVEQHQLALSTFQEVLRISPGSAFTPTATFLAGMSAESLGDRKAAIAYYREHTILRPAVAGYVLLRLGDLHRDSGDRQSALYSYQQAASISGLPPSLTVDALQRSADLQKGAKDYDGATKGYQAILGLARNPTYRATILTYLGDAQAAAGQKRQAAETYLGVLKDYAETGNALASLRGLDALGAEAASVTVDPYRRALVHFYAGSYADAITVWRQYIEASPKGDGTAWARYYIGLSLQRQGEYKAAVTEYETVVALYQGSSAVPEARLGKARCLRYLGDEAAAAVEYLAAARANPGTSAAQRGFWEAGLSFYRIGSVLGAISSWDQLLVSFPESEYRNRALFWSGKALLTQGKTDEARARLTQAAAENPPGHYALRAADLLAPGATPKPTAAAAGSTPAVATDQTGSRAAVEAWVAGWAPAQPPKEGANQRLLSEPHFSRGSELAAMGLAGDANEEYRLALEVLKDDAWALLDMAYGLRAEGQNHYAVSAASRLLTLSPARWAGAAPDAVQRLLYPFEYRALLEGAASQHKVDPLVLASLIRQESLFSAAATSSADARGLTQVIPSTAKAIAAALDVKSFRLTDLYRPRLSLQFGAYYLSEMLRLAKGDIWMALAAYNGGYGNAVRWAGGETPIDQDLFLENVTYSETQSYLQAVGRNLRFYRTLYASPR